MAVVASGRLTPPPLPLSPPPSTRRRRIRQLEHCNPAVFGNVCLTPYQDLSQDDLNSSLIKMASITSLEDFRKSSKEWILCNYNSKKMCKQRGSVSCEECRNGRCLTIPEMRFKLKRHDQFDSDDAESTCTCNTSREFEEDELVKEFTKDAYYNLDFTLLEKRRCSVLVDQLLLEIYTTYQAGITDYNSGTSCKSMKYLWMDRSQLELKEKDELEMIREALQREVVRAGNYLVRRLKRRDALSRQKEARFEVITCLLKKIMENTENGVPEFSPEMRFSLQPLPGDSGFTQWHSAMKMVSQLPEGIPAEFRRQLWLSLAEKHLQAKGVDWSAAERDCFSEWSHPADAELGVQIVKDLHRTGCSLFCGKDGKENQALLKRVLLAYARWNKNVGYCQGFNMLAALILQVTEKSETDALKLMIYLIEGVLPESYFADSLRGLSVDMAVFRELLRTKLPKLSKHLDTLQVASKEGTTSYEPPLTNVFTMQWFLTLFCNCLPQPTVLRVWDLILLEGNEILLRTSLAIWQVLADRIMTAKTADEFYCVMGMLMREILEFDLIDANTLVKGIVTIGPLTELSALREHYLYNINPWGAAPPTDRSDAPANGARRNQKLYHRDKLVLDIGVLKKQYTKLKQRQRQAHVIFNTAVARQTTRPAPVAMNHLLLGKSALVPAKKPIRVGPPKGAVPPPRHAPKKQPIIKESVTPPTPPKTLHWKDEEARRRLSSSSSSSSSDTELCDEPEEVHSDDDELKKSQLPDLPDDNLATPMGAQATPSHTPTAPDVTSDTVNSDTTHVTHSDIDVVAAGEVINVSVPPAGIIPDLLDFVAPPLSTSFNLNDDLIDDSQELLETSSDIYPTTNATEYFPALQRSDSLPSEDGFDFEKFLEERVKCLKDIKEKPYSSEESLDDTSETERIKYARRNSVRALEIIQENSLILHRILQCQSRLTPTPPLDDDGDSLSIDDIMDIMPSLNDAQGMLIRDRDTPLVLAATPLILEATPTTSKTPISNSSSSYKDLPGGVSPLLDDIPSTPEDTPTVFNTTPSFFADTPLLDDTPTNENLNFEEVQSETRNVFRPYENFREFLSKYQTSETAVADDITSYEEPGNGDEDGDGNRDMQTNIDTGDACVSCADGAGVEDDATYLNRLISKYNSISKQHVPVVEHESDGKREEADFPNTERASREDSQLTGLTEVTEEAKFEIAEVDYKLEKYRHKLGSPLSEPEDELIAIDKNSKYNSILEYSRNLDEKFNNLILRSPKLAKLPLAGTYSLDIPLQPPDGSTMLDTLQAETPKASHSFQDFTVLSTSPTPKMALTVTSPTSKMAASSYIQTTEIDQDLAYSSASSLDVDCLIDSPNLKSPNRIYNPFPVSISSRQNKEVPFRLGLYKK